MRGVINNIKNHSNWLSYYLYKYFGNKKDDFKFQGRTGLSVNVPKRLLHTYKECFFDETYLKGFPTDQLQTNMATILDIGANVGYFSLFSLSKYPKAKVFSYEPIPRNFQLLSKYRKHNAALSWQAVNSAVAMPDQKSLVLHFDRSDEFTTSATMFSDQKQLDDIEVACTSLKEIIESNQLQKIDLLKVDCEGAEYSILYNTEDEVFEKINRMAIETHD